MIISEAKKIGKPNVWLRQTEIHLPPAARLSSFTRL